jgi:hydroxyethylthiazole kinase-like uncharacterized protein yjeF
MTQAPTLNTPELWLPRLPWPGANTHKHARGRLVVVSGGPWSTGAARLAARGGLRIGAGLVTVLAGLDAAPVLAARLEAVMLRIVGDLDGLTDAAEAADAVVIGPAAGVGEATRAKVFALARTGAAMVLDADALTSFQSDPEALFSALDRDDVLTPHAGEFERLFPGLLDEQGRAAAALAAAERAGAVVLLKGSETLVAAPDGRLAVNAPASPWLATAGSGDVLAGFVGGLLAQGLNGWDAACAAAWIHAACADAFGPGLIAEDLPEQVPGVIRRLLSLHEASA